MSEPKPFGNPLQGKRRPFCPLLPTRDFLILRQVAVGKIRGIEMPDGSKADTRLEVIATGPDVQQLQVGDLVTPNPQYIGTVTVEAQTYFICQEDDVPAVFCSSRDVEVMREIKSVGPGDLAV